MPQFLTSSSSGPQSARQTKPRLLLLSRPSPSVLGAFSSEVSGHGLDARLGRALFSACNWHQSCSGRYEDTPTMRERLRQVGARIDAPAFEMAFNRIGGWEHWTLMGRGRPTGFKDMLTAVRRELLRSNLDAPGHSPHITISYRAPEPLKATLPIRSVTWLIDEVLLVVGQGVPYHYEVIDRWELSAPPASAQFELF